MTARSLIINGNALDLPLSDSSVNMVVTSPPYYGLRDYGISGQIGLEASMQEYIDRITLVFREVWRVLKFDGTLWLNLGDTYNARKELMGIPWRVAFALQSDGWFLRQDIIWNKPNPMPESVKDRCTKAHEYIFLLTKQQNYYYDYEAILEPAAYDGRKDTIFKGGVKPNEFNDDAMVAQYGRKKERWPSTIRGFKTKDQIPDDQHHGKDVKGYGISGSGFKGHSGNYDSEGNLLSHQLEGGIPARNKRSVWTVPTKGYKGAHFATFPPDLIIDCIKAGSKPGGIVLDPFNGSGTTGEVSLRLIRNYIGIELNREYIQLSEKRLAPFRMQPKLI